MTTKKNSATNLELISVLEKVYELCDSNLAEERLKKIKPFMDFDVLKEELGSTKEMMLLQVEKEHSFEHTIADHIWEYSSITGSALTDEELFGVSQVLTSFFDLKSSFFGKGKAVYPRLSKIVLSVDAPSILHDRLQTVFDEDGVVRDSASQELFSVRKAIRKKRESIRSKIGSILKEYKAKGYCDEHALPTVYHDRLVLPIVAGVKRSIGGLVHGQSKTGQIVYFEPSSIVEDNNEMTGFSFEERKALLAIFSELTSMVSEEETVLKDIQELLVQMDVRKAKALFAIKIGGDVPVINNEGVLSVKEGKNPQLLLNGIDPVPLDLTLGKECSWLIVSGPNAGGKTVTLKTIGQLASLVQLGVPVPCSPKSSFCLFDNVFVEIGDTQSVDDALSTYSGHLSHLKEVLESATNQSLVLIDELGTGTSPEYGGVIGVTILEEIFNKGGLGCVTSHFNELKFFGEDEPRIVQGSMGYNLEEMRPLFNLNLGLSGQSYALELMQRIGFDTRLIEQVKSDINPETLKYDELIKELNLKNESLTDQLRQAKKKRQNLEEQIADYKEVKKHQETLMEEKVERFKNEELAKLRQTEKDLKKILEGARKENNEEKIRTELSKVSEKGKGLQKRKKERLNEKNEFIPTVADEVQIGDHVVVQSSGFKGLVTKIKGAHAIISNDQLQMRVPLSDLLLSRNASGPKPKKRQSLDVVKKSAEFVSEIDIRGIRAEEVYGKLERFLDEAFVANASRLRIVHGKGGGVLRDLVIRFLKEENQVLKVEHEAPDRGGDGVTIAHL